MRTGGRDEHWTQTQRHEPRLRTCPEGFDSVHGVPSTRGAFQDDEYEGGT